MIWRTISANNGIIIACCEITYCEAANAKSNNLLENGKVDACVVLLITYFLLAIFTVPRYSLLHFRVLVNIKRINRMPHYRGLTSGLEYCLENTSVP